jgi:hypothetical protein
MVTKRTYGGTEKTYGNLRPMIDSVRKDYITSIKAAENEDRSGYFYLALSNGTLWIAEFASYGVMVEWLLARRSWGYAPITFYDYKR